MSYTNTFIRVSPDCPAETGIVPVSAKESKPVHVIQYELLTEHPYKFDYPALLFETHIRHKQISAEVIQEREQEIRDDLFSKNTPAFVHPRCPRSTVGVSITTRMGKLPSTAWILTNTSALRNRPMGASKC